MLLPSRSFHASWIFAIAFAAVVSASTFTPCFAQEAEKPAADLPDGKAIYEQYLEATGGKARFAELQSSRMNGTMSMQGMNGPVVINRARPGKLTVVVTFPGIGEINQGINGDIAWDVNPMSGARLLTGSEKAEMMKRADFDEEINVEKYYKSIVCTEEATVDDKKCYVVDFTDLNDNVEKRFFDADSHLMVKVETRRDMPIGKVKVESRLSDYRDVDGVKIAFKNEMSLMGTTQTIAFDEIVFDIDHDAGTFDPPEAVQKLIEKKKAKAEAGEQDQKEDQPKAEEDAAS